MIRSVIAAAMVVGLVGGASAQEARKINFGTALVDLEGKVMRDPDDSGKPGAGPVVTVGRAAAAALIVLKDASGAEQARSYMLAMKIVGGEEVELTAAEVKKIEDAVAKSYPPLISGQVWKIVDPASVK